MKFRDLAREVVKDDKRIYTTILLLFILYWTLITPSFRDLIYWIGIIISLIIWGIEVWE